MGFFHLHPTKMIKPLLLASLLFSLGWVFRLYAHSNEVLSLKMPPFLVVEQLTAVGSVVASVGLFCWLLALVVVLPSLLRMFDPLLKR